MDDLDRLTPILSTSIDWKRLGLDPGVIVENSKRVKRRFEPRSWASDDPVAIVAYGESLNETWKKIADSDVIFTCSGAHKFLIDRGIIPHYHVESDPQRHKPTMLGEPHLDVTYLMASICHPTYFDLLEEYDVILYHLLFMQDDIYKLLPSNEWLMTGGNTVGVRAMKLAYLWGFRNQHLFGFDGSGKHADHHPNAQAQKSYYRLVYDGKEFWTTHNLYYHIVTLFQDLNHSMPDLQCTFYGDGLASMMGRRFKRTKGEKWPMAVMKG